MSQAFTPQERVVAAIELAADTDAGHVAVGAAFLRAVATEPFTMPLEEYLALREALAPILTPAAAPEEPTA